MSDYGTLNKYGTWFGYGIKAGGTLFITGTEVLSGRLFNFGSPSEDHQFTMLSIRMGLGIGGGFGYVGCFVFNCLNLWDLHGKKNTDWGVNLSFGGKWSDVVKSIKAAGYTSTLVKVCKATKMHPKEIETFRNTAALLYTSYDMAKMSGPKMVTFDIPGAGAGVELSAHYLEGKMEFTT